MRGRRLIAMLAALVVGAAAHTDTPAVTPEARLARIDAEYLRSGETVRCLALDRIDRTTIVDARHILFRTFGGQAYLNTLPRPCAALTVHDTLRLDTRTGFLCDVDWVEVIEHGFGQHGPGCGLGRFERLQRRAVGASAPMTE